MLNRSKSAPPSFDQCVATLRTYKFDVSPAPAVANSGKEVAGTVLVTKHGCAAVLAPGLAPGKTVLATVLRAGVLINGEIGHVLDRGYQKFIKTPHAERPANADQLKALHRFNEELRQATGGILLYNESMGSVSDEYIYDRVKGRNLPESQRPTPAWGKPVAPGTPGEVS